MIRKADLEYDLPPELVAQHPPARRDESRLLVVGRETGHLVHSGFRSIGEYLPARSLLVLNDTRVVPARFDARRATGGRVRGLFVREIAPGQWEVLLEGRGRLRPGDTLELGQGGRRVTLEARQAQRGWRVHVDPPDRAEVVLAQVGRTPLPPYIRRRDEPADVDREDRERYQTIYAASPGAVAAPTAGLHFTADVFKALAVRGIDRVTLTLHVGLGTFLPITADDLDSHEMHSEWYDLPAAGAARLNAARQDGRPVVAVGTTSARVLETCAGEDGLVHASAGWTDLFIRPPYRFRAVDGLLTNFHLPGSTLLALVYAFAGRDLVRRAYEEAIAQRYRFYSYGDAMLIV